MEDTEIELFGPPIADCFGFDWWCGGAGVVVVVVVVVRARHIVFLKCISAKSCTALFVDVLSKNNL